LAMCGMAPTCVLLLLRKSTRLRQITV